ncbi:prenylated Rab acceptor protein 1-like [Dermacentor silvarum]|uniref:prenylated Rab acceptor protein 1-like n=1 Tax=Dermacentor silvarum TaxID=543639 RepID=UPI002101CABE|nr:prenylated Rab acceptor protein 1-like [Dermacentor silvarum]
MNREHGEVQESPNSRPTSSGDARVTYYVLPRRRLCSTSRQDDFDVHRAIVSWTCQELRRAQPWKEFVDTTKFSLPKSSQEVTTRIQSNVHRFRCNYSIIFVGILAACVMSNVALVASIVAVGAVCAVFKLNHDNEIQVWSTSLVLNKNHRLIAATLVALPLLYAADISSAVLWSFGAITVIGLVHATLYARRGSPNKSVAKGAARSRKS